MRKAIGYFVHHQGRGHAERAAAIVNAFPADRSVTLFCARGDIFPALREHVSIQQIPSLFEATPEAAPALAASPTPSTMHCAPLGWPTITRAVATIVRWMDEAEPALFVTDVSAELAQLARIASIPCVTVLQHGDREDPGHMAAYEGALGILAPYAASLEQAGRPAWMLDKIHYAPGVGITADTIDRQAARRRLGLRQNANIVLVVAGGGGKGSPATPITLGARDEPDTLWLTIGEVTHEWHETPPSNLCHLGWVDDPTSYIAASDRIVSSAGNTTVHQIAAVGRPWIVIPEWRYFDEQLCKARALESAGVAVMRDHWPASAASWRAAWKQTELLSSSAQRSLIDPLAAVSAAAWLTQLADGAWATSPADPHTVAGRRKA